MRSDSLDDPELAEQDRKRPRLDCDRPDAQQEAVMDGSIGAAQPPQSKPSAPPSQDSAASAAPSTNISPSTMPISPTSKVTINTKASRSNIQLDAAAASPATSIVNGTMSANTTLSNSQSVSEAHLNMLDGQHINGSANIEAISISSGSKSPEIEVADLEDFDQESTETRWTPVSRSGRGKSSQLLSPNYVYQSFPIAQRAGPPGNCYKAVADIAKCFQYGHEHDLDGEFFQQVKEWLATFLQDCPTLDRQFVLNEEHFWRDFPELIIHLLKRDSEPPNGARSQDLEEFMVDFARLAVLVIELDITQLRSYTNETSGNDMDELYSKAYMPALKYIMQHERIPFYEVLAHTRGFDVHNLIDSVVDELAAPASVDVLHHFVILVDELSHVLPRKQAMLGVFSDMSGAASQFLRSMQHRNLDELDASSPTSALVESIRNQVAQYYGIVDDILQQGIIKQFQWLTINNSSDFLSKICSTIISLAEHCRPFRDKMVADCGVDIEESWLSSPDLVMCIWKFKTLRKFITHGRMELRVQGVDHMQIDLVGVYNRFVAHRRDYMEVPLVQFNLRFLQQTKLINYIVGVDSHPQLISRSSNIVGFLCTTKSYTQEDTDVIWQAVTQSQDSRIVAAVLDLLKSVFGYLDRPALNYTCQKVLALPIETFDVRILEFIIDLFGCLRKHYRYNVYRDHVAFDLCTRMLRDVSAQPNQATELSNQIRQVADDQLSQMLHSIWTDGSLLADDDVRDRQFGLFAQDMAAHTAEATGSIQAMRIWLTLMPATSAKQLLHQLSIPDLLISDIEFVSSQLSNDEGLSIRSQIAFDARMNVIVHHIIKVPELLTRPLIERLWNALFTASWLPEQIKSCAWHALSNAITVTRMTQNDVISLIIQDYLPKLNSQDFSPALQHFMQLSVQYETRLKGLTEHDDDSVEIPGMERIWRVVLEAPPNTIESTAADFMIHEYLDNDFITKQPKGSIHATHLALVDRCVRQVMASAHHLKSFAEDSSQEDTGRMTILASDVEIRAEELRFDRSLLFLRKLLEGMKARPRYRSPLVESPRLRKEPFEIQGEKFELNLQVFGSSKVNQEPRQLAVGIDNAGDELWSHLSKMIGSTKFKTIYGGRFVALGNDSRTLQELEIRPGRLIVTQQNGLDSDEGRSQSPVDHRVMDHFKELYGLLDLADRLAGEVYAFLSLFPPQRALLDLVKSQQADAAELLPPDKPYRLLYCAQALRSCLEFESFSQDPDVDLLTYGVKIIVATFPQLECNGPDQGLEISVTQNLLECLLLAFRAKVPIETSRGYIQDPGLFTSNLLRFASNGQRCFGILNQYHAKNLVCEPLDTLLEGALHDDRVLSAVESIGTLPGLLVALLLDDCRSEVRRSVADIFLALAGPAGAKVVLKVNDSRAARSRFPLPVVEQCLRYLWRCLVNILPESVGRPFHCQEFFDACIAVLRRIGKLFTQQEVNDLFEQWSALLASYQHQEIIGSKIDDHVVWGFTKLLQECCKLCKQNGIPNAWSPLAQSLMSKFLFPAWPSSLQETSSQLPVLNSTTREELYDLVLLLSPGTVELDRLATLLQDHVIKDCFTPVYTGHDPVALRSEVGYAGLRNLSNTCYLNSLFTQLFMNPTLRDLILHANIVDESKQALLSELSKLFASMQSSYEKFVDTTPTVEAVVVPSFTGKEEHIDVAVQMDVDEFYNILFDQLEQQILDPEAKHIFKTIYGGQLVQQVKSKECEHISERFEPFSNIQVEIKGKRNLEEGLKAYVEGEVLQGDNKYSCTSCARHVDAVKRACLKEVPDNLIFNLKRFDYDIISGQRCKINDEFGFPEIIDMAPYTVEYLSNPEGTIPPDVFELTGVIVHAGTADSGHYYSFIRQRPSAKDMRQSWVGFNDAEVTMFDPMGMRDSCFGGMDLASTFHWAKIYSAYMLFYQRRSNIQMIENEYAQLHDPMNPLRLHLPPDVEDSIREQNEQHVRIYCIQDASHAKFIRVILDRIQVSESRQCSEDHNLETKILITALDYMHQISSRTKDHFELESMAKILRSNSQNCDECAKTILEWYSQGKIPGDTILRSPYPFVRRTWASILIDIVRKLSKSVKIAQGEEHEEIPDICNAYPLILARLFKTLMDEQESLQRWGRCWDNYFDLMKQIMITGPIEAHEMLEAGYLSLALDLTFLHTGMTCSKALRNRYAAYLDFRSKNRIFHYVGLLDFLASALDWVDVLRISHDDERFKSDEKMGLVFVEAAKLGLVGHTATTSDRLAWLNRAIIGRHNPKAVARIVRRLLEECEESDLMEALERLLIEGIAEDNISIAASYLEPCRWFCAECPSKTLVREVVQECLNGIDTIQDRNGQENFDFVQELCKTENEAIGYTVEDFQQEVLGHIGYWAPTLLLYPSNLHFDVAQETVELLQTILFSFRATDQDPQEAHRTKRTMRKLVTASLSFVKKHYLEPQDSKDRYTLTAGQSTHFIQVIDAAFGEVFGGKEMDNAAEEQRAEELTEVFWAFRAVAEKVDGEARVRGTLGGGREGSGDEWPEESDVEQLSTSEVEAEGEADPDFEEGIIGL